jgi:thiol-disulfide isomerase/thioredoxin
MPQMRTMILALVALVVIAALAVLYVMTGRAVHAPPASLAVLQKVAPVKLENVSFSDAQGDAHSLGEYKGRYVLLNLWATWCAPCVRELPALAKLQSSMPSGGLQIVAVDIGRSDPAAALQFLKAHDATVLAAYFDQHLALMKVFGAFGLPLSVLVDPQGREVARAMGPAEWDDPAAIAYFKDMTAHAPS